MLILRNTAQRSSWDQAPFPHELGVANQTLRLLEFNPVLFLQNLREVHLISHTGLSERRAILNILSDQQLVDVHNTLVDQCMKEGVNNEQCLFDAIDRTVEKRGFDTSKIYQGEVVPKIQTYEYNPLSGNSEPTNPNQRLYHLSLT